MSNRKDIAPGSADERPGCELAATLFSGECGGITVPAMAREHVLRGCGERGLLRRPNDADCFGAFQCKTDRLMCCALKIIPARRSSTEGDAAGKEKQK